MPAYVPEKGDFITLSFDPQSGHEQKGRRPALVICNSLFNKATGLAIVCPNYQYQSPHPVSFTGSERILVDRVRDDRAGEVS